MSDLQEFRLEELKKEIAEKRKEIYTSDLPMSIGELASLYKDGEITIAPSYQRFFRWNDEQKTRLIESVILNIPMPSVFFQENNNKWEVIDGLQRLSTFFEFMGILKDENDKLKPPLILVKTKYLPHFENVQYGNNSVSSDSNITCFDQDLKFSFRRYRIDVKTINKESDKGKKYEMFQRLNSGGSHLEPQEIRNAIMLQENEAVYNLIESLSQNLDFKDILPLSEKQEDERYGMEMITRYIITDNCDLDWSTEENVPRFLDEYIIAICHGKYHDKKDKKGENLSLNFDVIKEKFNKTCKLLNDVLGDSAFKKFDFFKDKFSGSSLKNYFICVMVGVGNNIDFWEENSDKLIDKLKEFQKTNNFKVLQNTEKRVNNKLRLAKKESSYFHVF
ncbi:MAG: DUF262 domain-containing protein [Defluviitaleaceae bacterium]|nr:DUF262 domain-containing protein [Defluviitaleaceae bacterium]